MSKRFIVVGCLLFSLKVIAQNSAPFIQKFYYGFSVYPEWLSKEQQIRLLDSLQSADVNFIRVSESSWGNIETSPGVFDFTWLKFFLDEMNKRNMKAMLGTGSYFPPQWLSAEHPEVLVRYKDGSLAHPMGRKDVCRVHPLYIAAEKRYITEMGKEFAHHPAVVAWQLDNESDAPLFNTNLIDYNPANEKAWTAWLKKKYGTIENFNSKLRLIEWAIRVKRFEDVLIPRSTSEGFLMAQLWVLFQQFSTESLLDDFLMQKKWLRAAGVKQWIATDWTPSFSTPADYIKTKQALNVSGVNYYQPVNDAPSTWAYIAWQFDLHRSVFDLNQFLLTETRIGSAADVRVFDNCGTEQQFRMWMIHPAAFGAAMILHWTANRFASGRWPQWGGLLDWSENLEPDYAWVKETGAFYKKWGDTFLQNPVKADAVVITDFTSRLVERTFPNGNYANYDSYPAEDMMIRTMNAFHRLSVGVDAITPANVTPQKLNQYKMAVVTNLVLKDSAMISVLENFASSGGTVVILPMTEYQTADGIYLKTGFDKKLSALSGVLVRTIRFNGSDKDIPSQKAIWSDIIKDSSIVGMHGFFELLEPQTDVDTIAKFYTPSSDILNNRVAATERKIGKGRVIKLGFFPADSSAENLIHQLCSNFSNTFIKDLLDENIQAVPRTDGSTIVMNTSSKSLPVKLASVATDRFTGKKINKEFTMQPYEVVWLEQ